MVKIKKNTMIKNQLILSPLCLPISPRGHELFSLVFMLIFIFEQDE